MRLQHLCGGLLFLAACGGQSEPPRATPPDPSTTPFFGVIDSESANAGEPPQKTRCVYGSSGRRCDMYGATNVLLVTAAQVPSRNVSCISAAGAAWTLIDLAGAQARMTSLTAELLKMVPNLQPRATGERDTVAGVPCTVQEIALPSNDVRIRSCLSNLVYANAPAGDPFGGRIELWTSSLKGGVETSRSRVLRIGPPPSPDPLATACVKDVTPVPL